MKTFSMEKAVRIEKKIKKLKKKLKKLEKEKCEM
jgi:hypothetical protein